MHRLTLAVTSTVAILALLASPALAQATPAALTSTPAAPVAHAACSFQYDAVVSEAKASGQPIYEVPQADLPALLTKAATIIGPQVAHATRAFVTSIDGHMLLCIELDGCLLPPVEIVAPAKPDVSA